MIIARGLRQVDSVDFRFEKVWTIMLRGCGEQ